MGLMDVLQRLLGDAMEWRALHTQTKDQIKPELVLALACDLWAESHSIAAPTSVGDFQRSLLERLRLLGTVSFPCYPVFTLTSFIAVLCSTVSTFVLDRLEVCLDITESITDIILPPRKASPTTGSPEKPKVPSKGDANVATVYEEVAETLMAPSSCAHHPNAQPAATPRCGPFASDPFSADLPPPPPLHAAKAGMSADRSYHSPSPPSRVEMPPRTEIDNVEPATGRNDSTSAKASGGQHGTDGGGSHGSTAGFVHLLVCWVMTWFAPAGRIERGIRVTKRMIFLPWKVWRQAWALARGASEKVSRQTALLKQFWRWRLLAYRR
eukprot:GHVS01040693.1.p1 GENE.GHVS01040693.1~~GHVS01040693.1.p1  ORF type:complete len:325 (-),score=40.97 GHVS01040693.1:950-1924(-)